MGPRLLHGFLNDRGIQFTLGIYVAAFAFSLFSLRAVSDGSGGAGVEFVPHYNVTVAMLYAAACVALLVYYIAHMARSISMTRVVNLLAADLESALEAGTKAAEEERNLNGVPAGYFLRGREVYAPTGGYLQQVDYEALGAAAATEESAVELLVRPGDHLVRGTVIGRVVGEMPDSAIHNRLIIGNFREETQDLEFSVRQLLEVGVRALSPGTNDPFTALDVIDRFAETLAELKDRQLPRGILSVDGVLRVQYAVTTFEGLVDVMFHQLRQNAHGTTVVYMRLLEAFTAVVEVMQRPERRAYFAHHGELVWLDAREQVTSAADVADIRGRYRALIAACGKTKPAPNGEGGQ